MYSKQIDSPSYLRKSLERALREHQHGIIKEKSALEGFAEKYVIDAGVPGITPIQYFQSKSKELQDFFKNHRNIETRLVY